MNSMKERLARIETQLEQMDKKFETLFDLLNEKIFPAIANVESQRKEMDWLKWGFRITIASIVLQIGGEILRSLVK